MLLINVTQPINVLNKGKETFRPNGVCQNRREGR